MTGEAAISRAADADAVRLSICVARAAPSISMRAGVGRSTTTETPNTRSAAVSLSEVSVEIGPPLSGGVAATSSPLDSLATTVLQQRAGNDARASEMCGRVVGVKAKVHAASMTVSIVDVACRKKRELDRRRFTCLSWEGRANPG